MLVARHPLKTKELCDHHRTLTDDAPLPTKAIIWQRGWHPWTSIASLTPAALVASNLREVMAMVPLHTTKVPLNKVAQDVHPDTPRMIRARHTQPLGHQEIIFHLLPEVSQCQLLRIPVTMEVYPTMALPAKLVSRGRLPLSKHTMSQPTATTEVQLMTSQTHMLLMFTTLITIILTIQAMTSPLTNHSRANRAHTQAQASTVLMNRSIPKLEPTKCLK